MLLKYIAKVEGYYSSGPECPKVEFPKRASCPDPAGRKYAGNVAFSVRISGKS